MIESTLMPMIGIKKCPVYEVGEKDFKEIKQKISNLVD
jgi:hypothetical protein